jgi:FHA domain
MTSPATVRDRLASTLRKAYAGGLLSDETFAVRLDEVLSKPLLEPAQLIGDLQFRDDRLGLRGRLTQTMITMIGHVEELLMGGERGPAAVLALDWDAGEEEVLIGRSSGCQIVIGEPTVSRRHARLRSRDGRWVLQDLGSTNGTFLNGRRVGRCELRPGDLVLLGEAAFRVD